MLGTMKLESTERWERISRVPFCGRRTGGGKNGKLLEPSGPIGAQTGGADLGFGIDRLLVTTGVSTRAGRATCRVVVTSVELEVSGWIRNINWVCSERSGRVAMSWYSHSGAESASIQVEQGRFASHFCDEIPSGSPSNKQKIAIAHPFPLSARTKLSIRLNADEGESDEPTPSARLPHAKRLSDAPLLDSLKNAVLHSQRRASFAALCRAPNALLRTKSEMRGGLGEQTLLD